ncbi:3-deoxy-7-phosphoheptulonate synthase [Streptomyces sp. NPDC050255]|uniref:3-deoxy-7-phosphoheptulonate synthase n=1 Tax=Streptomyces sp. NPDC050255 TaxID=3365606 RepID=UPI0037B974E8
MQAHAVLDPARPSGWTPSDWRHHPAAQQPDWPDRPQLRRVRARLAGSAPLVRPQEVLELRRALAEAAHGAGFVLQLGDCAETFDTPTFAATAAKAGQLHTLAGVIRDALGQPVIPVGRLAGQYAKPRSSPTERVGEVRMPSFRGHLVNDPSPEPAGRTPDAMRLLQGQEHARDVLALLRELAASGMTLPGARTAGTPAVWTSHEALVLDYEEPQVRRDPLTGVLYLASTHLPWIGARTGDPDGAHVRFLSGVVNPVGVKIGPSTGRRELAALCARLDPDREPGRLVLISRMGADRVRGTLPPLVAEVARLDHPVVWLCDPVHGNTYVSDSGYKTRDVATVGAEIRGFFAAVREAGGRPGGLHLEATPADVTECVGGGAGVADGDLPRRYETACDPRLNGDQTAEIVALTAQLCAAGG